MATFTESQITDLCRIIGTNSDLLSTHLDYYETLITDSDKTAVLADVTAYELIEDDNVFVEPNVKNFGAKISPDGKRALIRNRIVNILQCSELVSGMGGGRLIRA